MGTKTLEQHSAQDLAGLQVDILQRLRNGNLSWEQIDWFRNLPFVQREDLMKKPISTKLKLENSSIVIDALTEEIDIKKHFTENKKVKYYLGNEFQNYVLNGIEKINNLPEMNFSKYKVIETVYDKEIIENFYNSKPTNRLITPEEILWIIIFLTSNQPNGETGILQTNDSDYATRIGYMICSDGTTRTVNISWSSKFQEWDCDCDDLSDLDAENYLLF